MPDIPDIGYLLTLKPEQAIKYFQQKGYTFSWDWKDVLKDAHTKAFTIAKAMSIDILQDIRNGIDKAINDGTTFEDFKRDLKPILKSQGWWGKVAAKDVPGYNPENGGDPNKEVQLGSPRRLETIYRTNIRTAVAVGRYKDQIDQSDERPYWRWVQVDRPNKRPMHAKLNNMLLRWDDPFWDTCYPPNGFGCECHIRALTKAEVKEMGLKVMSGDAISFTPDPGWDYNPGKDWMYPYVPQPIDDVDLKGSYKTVGIKPDKLPELESKKLEDDYLLEPHEESGMSQEDYVNIFLKEFNTEIGKPVFINDVTGDQLIISDDLFKDRSSDSYKIFKSGREQYLKVLADTLKDPQEVWTTWVEQKNKLRFCKRFIGIYGNEEAKISGFAVFDWLEDVWKGTTIFKPGNLDYLNDQRNGTLTYIKNAGGSKPR